MDTSELVNRMASIDTMLAIGLCELTPYRNGKNINANQGAGLYLRLPGTFFLHLFWREDQAWCIQELILLAGDLDNVCMTGNGIERSMGRGINVGNRIIGTHMR